MDGRLPQVLPLLPSSLWILLCSLEAFLVVVFVYGLTGCGIKKEPAALALPAEVEHILQRSRDCVIRLGDLAQAPVVFDKAQDRALIRSGVVNEVPLGKR